MEKEKEIETTNLLIKGNIMSWEGTIVQLSNISFVSTLPLEPLKFPRITIVLLIIGVLAFKLNGIIAVILLVLCAGYIYYWASASIERESKKVLSIGMNSGNDLHIIFNDKVFLQKVFQVLKQIFIEGGIDNQTISINIQNSQISGNAKILNDFNIS